MDVKIESNADEFKKALADALMKAGTEIGLVAESHAAEYCPVQTGNLRNSIKGESEQVSDTQVDVIVGTNVEYGPYVELGTVKMGAKPYLRPAIQNHMNEYRAIFQKELS